MLAAKETLPLWRRRRANLVMLERALKARRTPGEHHSDAEQAVLERKIAQYRFDASKGRIRPPG